MSGKKCSLMLCFICFLCMSTLVTHAQEDPEEYDGTDYLVKPENNKAAMAFPVPGAPMDAFFAEKHYVRAFKVMPEPIGITDHISSGKNQLQGESGFHFYLPTSLAGHTITQYALTGFSARYMLTRETLGEKRFGKLTAEAKRRHVEGESMGEWFTPKDSSFLSQYGLCIYMCFQDGTIRNITTSGVAMVGINLADADNGNLEISYGAVAVDQDATDSTWHAEERVDLGEESLSLIYDGIADDIIDVTWWLADLRSTTLEKKDSGGCNSSASIFPLLAFFISAATRRLKFACKKEK